MGEIWLDMMIEGKQRRTHFYVMDSKGSIAIIGFPWLESHNVLIDCEGKTLLMRQGSNKLVQCRLLPPAKVDVLHLENSTLQHVVTLLQETSVYLQKLCVPKKKINCDGQKGSPTRDSVPVTTRILSIPIRI